MEQILEGLKITINNNENEIILMTNKNILYQENIKKQEQHSEQLIQHQKEQNEFINKLEQDKNLLESKYNLLKNKMNEDLNNYDFINCEYNEKIEKIEKERFKY